jgi:signal transduction histidine kinase/CheY-like chemotaxis protein
MKLKFKLSIMTIAIVTVVVTGVTAILVERASKIAMESNLRGLRYLVQEQARFWQGREDGYLRLLQGIADVMGEFETLPAGIRRDTYDNMLLATLNNNPDFVRIYSVWKPNAMDGMDAQHINRPVSTPTGQYAMTFTRENGKVEVTKNLVLNEVNVWINGPNAHKDKVDHPTPFNINGKDTYIIRMGVPITKTGTNEVVGHLAVLTDIALIQELVTKTLQEYEEISQMSIYSGNGCIMGSLRPERVGRFLPEVEALYGVHQKNANQAVLEGKPFNCSSYSNSLKSNVKIEMMPFRIGNSTNNWSVMIASKEQYILRDVIAMRNFVIALALIAIMAAVVILYLALKSAIKQIINSTRFRVLRSYVLILIIILAFALMVTISSVFMSNIVSQQLENNALVALDYLETNIATDLKEPRSLLGTKSETIQNMILHGAGKEEVHTYLKEITRYLMSDGDQLADFDGLFGYFDVFGGELIDGQDRTPPENYNPCERPWYKEAVAAGGEIVFIQPHLSVMSEKPTTIIAYGRALFDNDGNLLGVVALNMNFERVKGYIVNFSKGKLWFGILLDEDFNFIFHRDHRLEGTSFANINSDTAGLVALLRSGNDYVYEYMMKNYLDIPSITFMRKMENGWYLGIVSPKNEYFAEVKRVRLILILIGTVLSAIFSVVLARIIAEKHKADAKINEAEKAIVANRVKSDFLAKMSHEIRSPMNVILGITEMQLEKKNLPPDTLEALGKMQNSGYLLLNIINDILDLSKIESGKMELAPGNYDVASLINDTVQFNVIRFDSKPIQFVLKIDENLPSTLFGDALRIKQILNNILSNAFKYTEMGEVVISFSVEGAPSAVASEEGAPDANATEPGKFITLVLIVSDTGHGMNQEQLDKLFDDYTRFNINPNRQIQGTGLGMSITKRFIELMKGEITVKSEPGKGTEFTIRIPQGYVDSPVLGKEGTENLQKLCAGREAKQQSTKELKREYMPYGKVLIVDDMEPNIYVTNMVLAPYGLSISTTTSGQGAIDKIKSGMVYDIIFMDQYMPEMDGIEATKLIRSLGYKHPIVALTANALVGQAKIFLENGFDGFISKPIDIRQLNLILNKFVRDTHSAETVETARQIKNPDDEDEDEDTPDLTGIKALIVDDFKPNLDGEADMLKEYKIQVDCLLNGLEAVECIKKGEKYDIIFMDIMMPVMDGIEATKLIRSLGTEYASKIPIIALTAMAESEAEEKEKMLLDNGFNAVLYKPFTFETVDTFIKGWMSDNIKNCKIALEKKENTMEVDIPGVDNERIKKIYGKKFNIYLNVLRSYLDVVPKALEEMSRVSAETLPSYVTSVHGVKSVSDFIGAEEARKMALELEMLGKAGDLAGVLAKNDTLIKYVKELITNIQSWMAKAGVN